MNKLAEFLTGGIFKEAKELIATYWPPEVSPEKRAEFESRMAELEATKETHILTVAREEMALTVEDRKSARESLKVSHMPQILSFMLTGFIAGIVYLLFYAGVPEASKEALLIVLGVVIKEWGGSMQFWFGTTRGSQEKNRIIAQSEPVR